MKKFTKLISGALAALLTVGTMLTNTAFAAENKITLEATDNSDLISITEQPADAVTNWPDGAAFHVEVDRPEFVESYQWYWVDASNVMYELGGKTGRTETLELPSTRPGITTQSFRCVITDILGKQVVSEAARIYLDNKEEQKPYMLVGEYVITAGGYLDLSKTPYGSGLISLSKNTEKVTLDHVNYDNTNTVCCEQLETMYYGGILYYAPDNMDDINIELIGDCNITLTQRDGTGKFAGAALDIYSPVQFIGRNVKISGEGTFRSLFADCGIQTEHANLIVDVDADIRCDETDRVQEGIHVTQPETNYDACSITITSGKTIDIKSSGDAIKAWDDTYDKSGSITIGKDTDINITLRPVLPLGTKPASAVGIYATNVCVDGANINVYGDYDASLYTEHPLYWFEGITAITHLELNNTNFNATLVASGDENFLGIRMCGIEYDGVDATDIKNSDIQVTLKNYDKFQFVSGLFNPFHGDSTFAYDDATHIMIQYER